MNNITETIDYLNGKEFSIQHPYADFTFTLNKPILCGGTLYVSVWDLKGKITFNGDTWFDVDTLKPKEDEYIEYFYETIINDFGWVYQDIFATLDVIIENSILRKFRIVSISNKPKPSTILFNCDEVSDMDRRLLVIIDDAKIKLSEKFNIKGISISKEHIIVIDIIDPDLPSIDLNEEDIPQEYVNKIIDIEKGINYILNSMSIGRYCIGKIHKH